MKFMKKLSLCICAVVLSLSVSMVAYAGFTRQYTPQVKDFGIKVSTQENMMISTTGEAGTFKDLITYDELLDSTQTNLLPLYGAVEATGNDYENLILRDGSNNVVYSSKNQDDNINVNSTYISFNLYFTSSSDMNLYLGENVADTIISIDPNSTGNLNFEDDQKAALLNSMRIAFLVYDTTYPTDYAGTHIKYSDSPFYANVYSTGYTNDTYSTYMFTETGYNTTTGEGHNLAVSRPGYSTKVKVVIWLEGANLDTSILSAIADLKFNIAFQAVKI